MPQLEFGAIRAVTPRWRLDIMGRGGVQREEEKRRICADVAGLAAMSVFCAAKGSSSGLRPRRGDMGAKKATPRGQFRRGPARL